MSEKLVNSIHLALIDELEALHAQVLKLLAPLTEEQIWTRPVMPGNSAGHLVLHLTGNLNHFVGAQLGKSGYVRDRDREFSEQAPPARQQLLENFQAAIATFRRVVEGLGEEQLLAAHPEERLGSVLKGLVHLVAHFALHRGQISYLVRLVKEGTFTED